MISSLGEGSRINHFLGDYMGTINMIFDLSALGDSRSFLLAARDPGAFTICFGINYDTWIVSEGVKMRYQ